MVVRCMRCGGGIEVGNELALFVERAGGELVQADDPRRWATLLIGVVREKTHPCKSPAVGVVDLRLAAYGSRR